MSRKKTGNILIVTVTKVEAQAVLDVFSQAAGAGWTRQAIGQKTYYDLGIHGGAPVFMVQSEMGSATPGGAVLTVRRAIQDKRPQAVIMCGIAFGLRRDEQQVGDILVAKQIQYYEPRKVDARRGQIPRGDRAMCAERLLDRFRSGDLDWDGTAIHFGLVLSGEKLVNDPGFRDRLLQIEPEAIGGEMEGAGLYAAARDAKVDWILVKAICDWADGEKDDEDHSLAARNAAQFVLHVLRLGGWGGEEAKPPVSRQRSVPDRRSRTLIPLPPTPYFAHPYPLQKNFTGRVPERETLTAWMAGDGPPLLAVVAIGGMGKSALTWAWLQRDVLGRALPGLPDDACAETANCRLPEAARPEGVLWWSFYGQATRFDAFLDAALRYVGEGWINLAAIRSIHDKVRALVDLLQQRRVLLVLDGFERALRAYAGMGAAYQGDEVAEDEREDHRACTNPHAGNFLRWAAAVPLRGRVLLTSRLFPRELDDLPGCGREDLDALAPADAVTFLRAQGVRRGTRAEIEAACQPYGYHPLALRLLAGVIARDKRMPGDVRAAARYPIVPELKGQAKHHILQVAYDVMEQRKQRILSRFAAFRSPMDYEALLALNPYQAEEPFDAALDELLDRGLLLFDEEASRERGTSHYDLHPVVRRYAYDRLGDKEGTHIRLRDYFADVPEPERVESVDDLMPTIELYHHTVGAGGYDEAFRLFRDRLASPLYYRFGAYQLRIELMCILFPNGEPFMPSGEAALPQLSTERDQSWTANALANSYSLSGWPGRAVQLFELCARLDGRRDDKRNLATDLSNLAYMAQIHIGALAAAEKNLRRSIALCQEIEDEFSEAIGHKNLGRLLAYTGAFEEAGRELKASTAYWEQTGNQQGICLDDAYRTLRALLMEDADTALEAARQAHEIACSRQNERDRIRAEWLLGAAQRARGELAQAEPHLEEALRRCRCINLVELEPNILLEMARLRYAAHRPEEAVLGESVMGGARSGTGPSTSSGQVSSGQGGWLELAHEALDIAERCEYRLVQADCHNFLAQAALDAGDLPRARRHAEIARERAECDGPPHRYEVAFREAERLLGEIGVGEG
ncbi:MAG: hypothetical protein GY835_27480 [bacterium]|nr:hypothetical protein [bacterium]